ncbi:MAG: hypothetical protein HOA28_04180 [Euryarchaeota archaeon]|jgi:hypothetical protein|nr:hypothetical protein [Euryarchaeota archaeon]
MRIIAPMMILIMMASTLAGCTGGDPDGGGNDNIDMDILNQLIDDNLQDFINNTSSMIYTIDYTFTLNDLWSIPEPVIGDRGNTYPAVWSYYDYLSNTDRTDTFLIDCSSYYIVGSAENNSNNSGIVTYWDNSDFYDDAWTDLGFNSTIRDMMHNYAWSEDFRWECDDNYFGPETNDNSWYSEDIYSVIIPEGYAVKLLCGDEQMRIYSRDNSQILFDRDGYFNTHFDGVPLYCGYNTDYLGGLSDFELVFSHDYLLVEKEYRIMVSYELIPVIALGN